MNNSHTIKASVLKAYDIRGVVDTEITEVDAYFIGRSFGTILKNRNKQSCILGYDGRHTSIHYSKECARGLIEAGIDVVVIGLLPTPAVYYGMKYLKVDAGLIISASHNPKEYNGFKMSYNGIHNCFGKDVTDLYYIIINSIYSEGKGTITNVNIKQDYINMINSHINLGNNKLKVVYDCGNGTTSIVAPEIFKSDSIEYIPLFAESDPNFPNHHPDPSVPENLKKLSEKVIETQADLGIAFDGDGDRVGAVDEKGNIITIDKFMRII